MALPVDRRIPPEARSLLADAEGQWVRLWTGDDWFALADAWVRERLAAAGIAVSGRPVPYKIRFWAAVWCYPTDHGLFWFKENNPGQAFEAGLVAAMAQALPHHCCRLVTEYAGLQRDTVPAEEALLASGLTSLAPSRLADAVHSIADWFSSLGPGHPLRLDRPAASPGSPADPITLDGVRRAGDTLAGWGTRLTGAVPMALDQNDLHVHNVFSSNPSAPFRFFDFGDAVWGHPFATLPCVRAALTDPENVGGETWAEDDPRLDELTDAYLMEWSDLAPLDVLRRELELATPLHAVHRLVSWHRLLVHADEIEADAWAASPHYWLREVVRLCSTA